MAKGGGQGPPQKGRGRSGSRSAKQVVDAAIRENKIIGWLLYTFATLVIAAGLTALFWGMLKGEGVVSLAGIIASTVFYPTLRLATSIRKDNMTIRALEYPLSLATTVDEAIRVLRILHDKLIGDGTTKS
jgi:hypothetical protein